MHELAIPFSRCGVDLLLSSSIGYQESIDLMLQRVADIIDDRANQAVWLLEYPALYTAGASAQDTDLLDPNYLPIHQTDRGGKYTYHGPGQRVVYLMLNLKKLYHNPDIRRFIADIGRVLINSFQVIGLETYMDENIGIWVKTPTRPKKIASFGFKVKRWVTYHGIAININPNLSHFNAILPCGLNASDISSLAELGLKCTMQEMDAIIMRNINEFLGYKEMVVAKTI